jgi:hypothetical protein
MSATVTVALSKLQKHPVVPELVRGVLRAVNQHLNTIKSFKTKIEYLQEIIGTINNTIIPTAVDKAATETHKDLIRTTIARLTTLLQDNISAFQAENVPDPEIVRLEYGLIECVTLIKEAAENESQDMGKLPEGLIENLKNCSTTSKKNITRLNIISRHGKNSDVKDQARTLYRKYQNVPLRAGEWYDYFDARHEKEWAAMEKEATLLAEEETEMLIKKEPNYSQSMRSLRPMKDKEKTVEGGRKTRKRKRKRKNKRKTRKSRKKKTRRRRKPKKRHRHTKRH